jgi:hypothetical protein
VGVSLYRNEASWVLRRREGLLASAILALRIWLPRRQVNHAPFPRFGQLKDPATAMRSLLPGCVDRSTNAQPV